MPFRFVMFLVLVLGAALVGHVRGQASSVEAKARHHATVRVLTHGHHREEPRAIALYDEDDDDDDDVGLAAPPEAPNDDDAAPSAIELKTLATKLPPAGLAAPAFRRDLGPSSGHPRADEPPPRA